MTDTVVYPIGGPPVRPFISPARCSICGFRIAALKPVHTRIADDKQRSLIVAHLECVS